MACEDERRKYGTDLDGFMTGGHGPIRAELRLPHHCAHQKQYNYLLQRYHGDSEQQD